MEPLLPSNKVPQALQREVKEVDTAEKAVFRCGYAISEVSEAQTSRSCVLYSSTTYRRQPALGKTE